MADTIASARAYARLVRDLRPFVREQLSDEQAVETVRQGLAGREAAFLDVVDRAILARPSTPVARLLAHADVGIGDLRASVAAHGLEATLRELYGAGVRLSLEEMRGRVPIVRDGLELRADPDAFDNPLVTGQISVTSGGSTGGRIRAPFDLPSIVPEVAHFSLLWQTFGLHDRPVAAWYPAPPGVAGIKVVLAAAKLGSPATRWFSQTPLRWRDGGLRHRILTTTVSGISSAIPRPEHVPPDDSAVVVDWVARRCANGTPPVVMCTPSSAVRVCAAAAEARVDVAGTFFRCGGEPYTAAKDAFIREAGCAGAAAYYVTEAGGPAGVPCGEPSGPGDVHLCADRLALLQIDRGVGPSARVGALVLTTLSASSSKLVINLESDDYAEVDEAPCGCLAGSIGLGPRLRDIRSHAKLTAEGMHFIGDELIRLVEEELPRRFGGNPSSYQLREEEGPGGSTRVALRVSPSVGPLDDRAVVDAVYAYLAAGGVGQRMMVDVWRRAGTLVVERGEPEATDASKTLPLLRARPGG